jgi:hypothetical protein
MPGQTRPFEDETVHRPVLNHLARLIYAEAVSWKPMHLAQLREYVDRERRGHYLEGHAGEYIMPNSTIYRRKAGWTSTSRHTRTTR